MTEPFIVVPEEHHNKVAIILTVLIMAILVGAGYLWLTRGERSSEETEDTSAAVQAAQRALLEAENQPEDVGTQELEARRRLLTQPN